MVPYSIHVIVEYNQAGSEIICQQIYVTLLHSQKKWIRCGVFTYTEILAFFTQTGGGKALPYFIPCKILTKVFQLNLFIKA